MPRVSIIVPAKDARPTIERAMRSVLGQEYGDWEVVLCDDGSSDDTSQRAADVLGERLTVVRHDEARGPAAARNSAIDAGSGELIAFLDADDELAPEFLAVQVAAFDFESAQPGTGVGLLACDADVVGDGVRPSQGYLDQFREAVEPLTLERVLRRNCVYIATVVPRSVGDEVGWFDPELFGTEDHDLWIRILETGRRAVLTPRRLATYHHSPGSVSSNIASQGANNRKTYERALVRGRLDPRQARIARREIRYNRAMEAAAKAWFGKDVRAGLRAAPSLVAVALTRPRMWGAWLRVLRTR